MTLIFFLIVLLVELKEACMPNFGFLGFLEGVVLWLETNKTRQQNNSVELEASLAPSEAEVGAVAKADQNSFSPKFQMGHWNLYFRTYISQHILFMS